MTEEARFQSALENHNAGRYSSALEDWDLLLQDHPEAAMYHLFRGWTLCELDRFFEALGEFEFYHEKKPLNAGGSKALFTTLSYLGRFEEAYEVAFAFRRRFRSLEDPAKVLKPKQLGMAAAWVAMIDTFDSLGATDLEAAKKWYQANGPQGLREYRAELLRGSP